MYQKILEDQISNNSSPEDHIAALIQGGDIDVFDQLFDLFNGPICTYDASV